MKGLLIGCACIILVLLLGASLSRPVGSYAPCAAGSPVVTVPTPVYAYRMVIWAEWIRTLRRQRPYHNPLRRYRLSKKQRRRLRQRLRHVLECQTGLALDSESPMPAGEVRLDATRWS